MATDKKSKKKEINIDRLEQLINKFQKKKNTIKTIFGFDGPN